jgi:hypothetical protein
MSKLQKIYSFITKKKPSPEYTRWQWRFKAIQLYVCAIGMDLSGLKLNELDVNYYFHRITYEQAYGFNFVYYAGVHGLLMGLALWKLFEIYWWGKGKVEQLKMEKYIDKRLTNEL